MKNKSKSTPRALGVDGYPTAVVINWEQGGAAVFPDGQLLYVVCCHPGALRYAVASLWDLLERPGGYTCPWGHKATLRTLAAHEGIADGMPA